MKILVPTRRYPLIALKTGIVLAPKWLTIASIVHITRLFLTHTSSSSTATERIAHVSKRRLRELPSGSLREAYAPTNGLIPSFLLLSLSDMSYKEIVLNYIITHDVPCLLRGDIEDGLRKCISDDDVYELILRINHRLTVDNCAVRGYDSVYVPMRYADEIASDCILKVLDKAKNEATQDV